MTTGSSTLITRDTYSADTATLVTAEEVLMFGGEFFAGNLNASGSGMSRGLVPVTMPCKLVAFAATHWNSGGNLAASATDFYSLQAGRTRAGTTVAIATRSTTLGSPWNQRTYFGMDVATFDPTNQIFSVGDILSLQITQTGAPATLTDIAWGARFEPLR